MRALRPWTNPGQGLQPPSAIWRKKGNWPPRSQACVTATRLQQQSADHDKLIAELQQTFADRERQNIDRLRRVLAYAEQTRCLSRHLLNYFGEQGSSDCNDCSRCRRGEGQTTSAHRPPRAGCRGKRNRCPDPDRKPFRPCPSTPAGALPLRHQQPRRHPRQAESASGFWCAGSIPVSESPGDVGRVIRYRNSRKKYQRGHCISQPIAVVFKCRFFQYSKAEKKFGMLIRNRQRG